MPDGFFQKKRKRPETSSSSSSLKQRPKSNSSASSSSRKGKARRPREEEGSDESDPSGDERGGAESMNLEHQYDVDLQEEDETSLKETPAQARVRLARMYLNGLGKGDADEHELEEDDLGE